MADNEVKIHVSADADLKGIDDAARKVDSLNRQGRSQTATEANPRPAPVPTTSPSVSAAGWESLERRRQELLELRRQQQEAERQGDTRAARDISRRADKMEKGIDREGDRLLRVEDEEAKRAATEAAREAKTRVTEERAAARERRDAEREVTREMKTQQGMRRAGVQTAANVFYGAEQIATGGSVPGAAASSLVQMGAGGGLLGLGASIVAAIAIGIKGLLDKEAARDTAQSLELRERSFGRAVSRNRNASVFGSSSALVTASLDQFDDIEQRKAARAGIDERARVKWYDPSTWTWGGLRKNEGQREREKNEAEIADLQQQQEKNLAAARRKFLEEEGGQELQILRGRAKRTLTGSREAMVAELGQEWLSQYKAAMSASGDDRISKEMADTSVQNTLRDRMVTAGSGLVDNRSGGAEIAAAARWASGAVPGQSEVAAQIAELHRTVQQSATESRLQNQAK